MNTKYGFLALLLLAQTVSAELRPDIAACEELKDAGIQEQISSCTTHAGCNLIMGSKKTCADAKTFFVKLKVAIGKGTKSFFGYSKEVTSNHVFEASLSDAAKAVEQLPMVREALEGAWWNATEETRKERIGEYGVHALGLIAQIDAADKTVLELPKFNGVKVIYIGTTHGTFLTYNDKDYSDGYGVLFFDDGEMHRGKFFDNKLSGYGDFLLPRGGRKIGYHDKNKPNISFDQVVVYPANTVYQGRMNEKSQRSGKGVLKWPNGKVNEEGIFESDKLVAGKRYNEDGTFLAEVVKPVPAPVAAPPPVPAPTPVVAPAPKPAPAPSKPVAVKKPANPVKRANKKPESMPAADACAKVMIINGKKICDE